MEATHRLISVVRLFMLLAMRGSDVAVCAGKVLFEQVNECSGRGSQEL
jgi:hypothetical protein